MSGEPEPEKNAPANEAQDRAASLKHAHESCFALLEFGDDIFNALGLPGRHEGASRIAVSKLSLKAGLLFDALCNLRTQAWEAEHAVHQVQVILAAAFDPPCVVRDREYFSYHEGIVSLATGTILSGCRGLIQEEIRAIADAHGVEEEECDQMCGSPWRAERREMVSEALTLKWPLLVRLLDPLYRESEPLGIRLQKEYTRAAALLASGQVPLVAPKWSRPMTVPELAALLDVSENTMSRHLQEWKKDGRAKRFPGRKYRVDVGELPDPAG